MKFLGKLDWLIIVILILAAIILFIPRRKSATIAEIYHDGRLVMTVDLRMDSQFGLEGMEIAVSGGRISVVDSDCPDRICVNQGAIDRPGIPIVCVPNRVLIKIPAGDMQFDAITQ